MPRIDPRAENYARFGEAYEVIVASVLVLLLVTHGIMLAVALGYHVSVARIVPALVGALFVVIGNMMPLVRPNWWFGIRTPWTLSNDRVWARTHRLAGYCMTAGGARHDRRRARAPRAARRAGAGRRRRRGDHRAGALLVSHLEAGNGTMNVGTRLGSLLLALAILPATAARTG